MRLSPYRKACAGALAALLSFLAPVVDDGLTVGELLAAFAAALTGAGIVYAAPRNAPE